jgi:hypothetical protein
MERKLAPSCYSVEVNTRTLHTFLTLPLLTLPLLLAGCRAHSAVPSADERAEQRAELESEREQVAAIPPPAKSRYMAVHSFESWENPYLTVQAGMVELHVTRGDANPTSMGVGGMLRPVSARREELNLSMDNLGEAISAVPADAWPYGRVVAVEEAHKTPASAEPAVRRNMEATIGKLNDLGVVVYDLNEGKLQ